MKLTAALLILFFSFNGNSQIIIKGKVTDGLNSISYCHVSLKQLQKGVYTDTLGGYKLIVEQPGNYLDTLVISHIGYKKFEIPVILNQNSVYSTVLLAEPVELNTTTVKPDMPVEEILKRVIKNIKRNYLDEKINQMGFYRELLTENDVAVKNNECAFALEYNPYPQKRYSHSAFTFYWDDYWNSSRLKGTPSLTYFAQHWPIFTDPDDKVNIIESRVNTNKGSNDGTLITLGDPLGGPADIVSMDNVKYLLNQFDPNLIKSYSFKLVGKETVNRNEFAYIIAFEPNTDEKCYLHNYSKKIDYPFYKGKILIDTKSFSVFEFTCQSVDWLDATLKCRIGGKRVINKMPKEIEYHVKYIKYNDRLTLGEVHYKSTHYIGNSVYKWHRDMYLYPDTQSNKKFSEEDLFPKIQETLRYRTTSYNKQYWKDYENSSLYVPLPQKYLLQLEKEISLEEQYASINILPKEIPKPNRAISQATHINEKNGNIKDSIAFRKAIEAENKYANAIQQKLLKNEKHFTVQCLNVLKYQSDATIEESTTKPQYWMGKDSLNHSVYFERLPDLSDIKIFDLTEAYSTMGLGHLTDIGFSSEYVAYLIDYPNTPHKKLNICKKGNNEVLKSCVTANEMLMADDTLLIYTKQNGAGRSFEIHAFNLKRLTDSVIYTENRVDFEIEISKSDSKRFVFVKYESKGGNEMNWLDVSSLKIKNIYPFKKDEYYKINHFGDETRFIASFQNTNGNKLIYTDIISNKPQIAYSTSKIIDDFTSVNSTIIFTEYSLFNMEAMMIPKDGKQTKKLDIVGEFKYIELEKEDKDSPLLLTVESVTSPPSQYIFNESIGNIELKSRMELQYPMSESDFVTEIMYAPISDGIKIPILISYKKDAIKDSITAVLFNVYGAYGALNYSQFDITSITYMQNGFILAQPAVRGYGTLGISWYNEGKQLNKKNSFTDFLQSVRFVKSKFGLESKKVFAKGTSAGGLIMGVMANTASEEFNTLFLDRPFLDVYGAMADSSDVLTTLEYPEWGNPDDTAAGKYIMSYSPLQNTPKALHSNLFYRVSYYDYVTPVYQAYLSLLKNIQVIENGKFVLFHTNLRDGHITQYSIKSTAEEYAFMKFMLDQ